MNALNYLHGFGNQFESEACPGTLPKGQNSPQDGPRGLYAEQVSGTAFTAPNYYNKRSWLYRLLPSVVHKPFDYASFPLIEAKLGEANPTQLRWDPMPSTDTDFLEGLKLMALSGSPEQQKGCAIYLYNAEKSMPKRIFQNSDGEMLIVPQEGSLHIKTEFGELFVGPLEIAVIPRGIKFAIDLKNKQVRGYVCENFGPCFELPSKGAIGANGLANPRDFQIPVASYEDNSEHFDFFNKFHGKVWKTTLKHSPFDVVAWHGNYTPYKYDLRLFNTINTVSFDHPDPSIFTVLTSVSERPGMANIDFVIFPPRWMVAEKTFRPPYYHRNIMSEFMGLVQGEYDAKPGEGFRPGGSSLHNCMSAHGPSKEAFEQACNESLSPQKIEKSMAIMFESSLAFKVSQFAQTHQTLQKNYHACWSELKKQFKV